MNTICHMIKAVNISNPMELASAGSTQLSGQQPPSVNKRFNPKSRPPKHQLKNRKSSAMKKHTKKPCYRCLDDKHSHSDCPFIKSECYKCGTLVKPVIRICQDQIRNLRFMNYTTCLIENVNLLQYNWM